MRVRDIVYYKSSDNKIFEKYSLDVRERGYVAEPPDMISVNPTPPPETGASFAFPQKQISSSKNKVLAGRTCCCNSYCNNV